MREGPQCLVWPFHSFTSHVMGWVGNNKISNGLIVAARGAFYTCMLMPDLIVKIQCKQTRLLSAHNPDKSSSYYRGHMTGMMSIQRVDDYMYMYIAGEQK